MGPAALIEDNCVRAPDTLLVNLEAGRGINDHLKLRLGVDNAFDSDASDICYYYESRLPGEVAPVADIHFSAPECIRRAEARCAVRLHSVPGTVIRDRSTEK